MSGPARGPVPRSYLYVPGDQPDKLARALDRGADAIIVDLEDAVAPAAKASARAAVADWLASLPSQPAAQIWVRVNPGAAGHTDVAAVATNPVLAGVMAAKTETAGDLVALDEVLRDADAGAGRLRVVPLLESAAAVLAADQIARAPRVDRLQLGEADLLADIGMAPGDDEIELLHVRSHVVLVSAARRLEPPVAPVSPDFRDLDALRRSTRALARLGFVGRACIHPAQIPIVNDAFTPSAEEVARARAIVERFERSVASGNGVILDEKGRMVDEAVVRQARRVLGRAR